MKTYFRTLMLLGFTGLVGSMSGCIIETTSNGNDSSCADSQYFEVYWAIYPAGSDRPLTCLQAPRSHVELVTTTGTYQVGVQCDYRRYNDLYFDFSGRTNLGIPAGTYELGANLIDDATNTVIATAAGNGPDDSIVSCYARTIGHIFDL